jgi:hypothetical protein
MLLRFCCPYMAWFTASTILAPLAGCEQAARIIQKATSEVLAARLPAVFGEQILKHQSFPRFFVVHKAQAPAAVTVHADATEEELQFISFLEK